MSNTVLSLLSAERLEESRRRGFWRDETIYAVAAAHARRAPDRPAVRDLGRRLSYRALLDSADALAADLAARGVRPGQRVAVWLPSRVETAVALLACSRQGYVFCPSLHRDHTTGDILALLERMRAAALIAQPGYGADGERIDIFKLAGALGFLRHAYRLAPVAHDSGMPFEGLLLDAPAAGEVATDPNRVSYLAFTSGTTGEPKGVMHCDNTLLANARALAGDWRLDADTVTYAISPLSHNLGLGGLVMSLAIGGELVVHDRPRRESLLDRLTETSAGFLIGVPTHAIDLLRELNERGAPGSLQITGFRISGAAVSAEVIEGLMRFGIVPQSGYGMTETCSHQYTLPDDDPRLIRETSGRACPGYEVRIWRVDDPDREVAPQEIGEIGGRGASLMLGYFDDQRASEEAFNAEGWFMTGDLGWLDPQGYLRITGRKKELIIRGGHNIHPARIESLAALYAGIDKVVAFAVADSRLGERICLAYTGRPAIAVYAAGLLSHLREAGLSRYEMPEYLLRLDEMPLTASGKVLKREVAAAVADGRLIPQPIGSWPTA